MRYPIVIHKENGSDYGVIVPDIPGCFSAGDSLDDAITQAQEAIECHLEGIIMDGGVVPVASSFEQYTENPDYAGGVWAMVAIDLSRLSDKPRRINITIPERVLSMIDVSARQAGETRSGFLARATMERLAH